MPIRFNQVYIDAAGYFLPGDPVDNDAMDAFIAPINRLSKRIKQKILKENGIQTRHYAIDEQGNTPLPPLCFARKYPPTMIDMRPAISLMGSSNGKRRFTSIVS